MDIAESIGTIAAFLTTFSFVPQVWRVWHSKYTRDISLGMYVAFTTGVAMWLIYGTLIHAWPIIIANSITLLLAGTVLILKIRFG